MPIVRSIGYNTSDMGGIKPTINEKRDGPPKTKFRSWFVLAAAFLSWGYLLLIVADGRYAGDIRGFLCLGKDMPHPSALATAPKTSRDGYDGQFYAALATDPFMRNHDTIAALDNPAFRGSRLMIPLLAWILSLGNADLAVYIYQFLCWTLGIAAIVLIARMLSEDGRCPAWALILILSGGLVASLIRTTPDAATVAFILAALWFHRRGRFGAALGFVVAAVLSREIAVILALGLAAAELREQKFVRSISFVAAPIAVWLAWKVYMQIWLGTAFTAGEKIFSSPFSGVVRKIGEIIYGFVSTPSMEIAGLIAVAASLVGLAAVASQKSRWTAPDYTFLGFTILIPFLSYSVYIEAWGFTRILIVLPFLAIHVAERQKSAWRRWSLRSVAIAYAIVGVIMLTGEIRAATRGRGLGRATIDAVSHLVTPSSRPHQERRRGVRMDASLPPLLTPIPTDPVSGPPGYWANRDRVSEFINR